MRLLGRADETAALRALLDRAGQGRSGVLVVHGEAGVGKTALLNDAAARADGFRIARVDGVESERELGYAGLHRLLLPLLDGTASLPAPQRDALGGVFGLVAGVAPDRLLIGLAVLTLLTDAGLEQPLLCVCDDAQWLDTETLEVLAFVGRRLQADHVALLFGVRDGDGGSSALRDLPRMHVGGLPDDAAHRLLDAAGPRRLDPEVARRVVAETRGNPLAIRELAGDLARDPRTGGPPAAGEAPPLAERLPLGRLIEERFRRQVAALPPDVRTLLLVVAAEPTGNAHLVWRALHRLEATGGASGPHALAAPAVAADLLVLRPVLGFRHPLIRSGVYAGADEAERRRVHAALAAVTDPVADGDRRAWHLAAAAPGPDEELARELERSAERARARGGYAAQSALLVQAAELTPSGPRHAARLLAAAPGALRAGQPVPALELLDRAGPDLDEDGRIAADRMRGTGYIQLGRSGDAVPLLLGAAERTVARDRDAAADLLVETLHATTVANWERCRDDARRLAEVALSLEPGTRFPDLLLAGHAEHLARGGAAAAPALRRA
ncbi:AAA family ATPase, partial [Actinomadura kijaniata]|uniref:AAA family ATPase n=1 Tax=Actinomadura kijaniata TaxID=46161 RepID=UPI000A54D30D